MPQKQLSAYGRILKKIPATVKYFSKKLTKILPCRASLHLDCTDDAMISSCHLRPLVTAKVLH